MRRRGAPTGASSTHGLDPRPPDGKYPRPEREPGPWRASPRARGPGLDTRTPADLRRVAAAMRSRRAWRGRCAEMRGAKTPVGPNRGPFPAVSKRLLRPAKNRRFAGYSWMARPGLEPGTPRFSVDGTSTRTDVGTPAFMRSWETAKVDGMSRK